MLMKAAIEKQTVTSDIERLQGRGWWTSQLVLCVCDICRLYMAILLTNI